MPIIKSAKKRVRVSAKAAVRNAKTKRQVREAIKAFKNALVKGKSDKIIEEQNKAFSALDKAVKKNVIHKNKAARKKSQLAKEAKTTGAKLSSTAKKASKPATKKTAKAPAKKPAVKKAPAKKTAAKKSATKKAPAKKTAK